MGRRKIEIKAIKDDRNRSVTFLKRKGGLFKKAHELAVLCSVDVAVIIFGHNKKLYEYSSSDMHEALGRYQYFGPPHEHKGPDDFSGKRDDDDEDDEGTPAPEEIQAHQSHPSMPPHLQHQPGFQHINHAPSASPPIPNGLPITRHGTPQLQNASRPSSRNHIRRVSSNLGPQQHGTPPPPPPPQNGFAYMPNPSMYNPNVHSAMGQPPRPGQFSHYGHPPAPQGTPPQPMHHSLPPQPIPPQHQGPSHLPSQPPIGMPPGSHAPVPQVTQAYMPEPSRSSIPPGFAADAQQERTVSISESSQDNPGQTLKPSNQSPPQPKSLSSKSRSIFTPIDDRGSVLARHFGAGPVYESPRGDPALKPEAPQEDSPDSRIAPIRAATEVPRTHSISSASDIKPPSRTNSGPLGSKRPQLKVQIPSESSDRGSATAESSSRDSAGNKTATPAKGSADNPPSGVVLPPPSPSAGAIPSAGASGPPNPFARPPPPATAAQNNAYGGNSGTNNTSSSNVATSNATTNNIETPISALPSRFVSDALLPSPSSFFPEWGFGRSGPDSAMLPSPLTFPTPAVQSGPSFSRDDEQEKKRKSPDSGPHAEGASKKPKT
ncbi:hypothetical protein NUU61_000727 [Penicillium alfredii]|uniref:MADS-box domain-containing protein n=1 Tax=Penicillium alfredii TaxID=1506179 RepID=A0A9W9GA70_9EURO|nr:uncharacterized protein NUU61_000727 [Penicillium alfredii]KAJ5114968.1 hypothetical protein NUU61_000727 [Penicillium alfredii]